MKAWRWLRDCIKNGDGFFRFWLIYVPLWVGFWFLLIGALKAGY